MLHQGFEVPSCLAVHFFFVGKIGLRVRKTKKIGVLFSLALFLTNKKIKHVQYCFQNKDTIANFYIIIMK